MGKQLGDTSKVRQLFNFSNQSLTANKSLDLWAQSKREFMFPKRAVRGTRLSPLEMFLVDGWDFVFFRDYFTREKQFQSGSVIWIL